MKRLLSILLFILSTQLIYSQAPTTQCSGVTITNITTTSFNINWNPGSGSYVLVIVKPAANSIVPPNNSGMTSYAASNNYGSGSNIGNSNYVVYKNANGANGTTVTGLTPGVNYEVIAYSYNFSAFINIYFLNTNINTSNSEQHYTLANQPTTISSINVIGTPGATTATLSTTGTGHTYNLVSVRKSSLSGYSPVDGSYYTPSTSFGSGAQIGGSGTLNYSTYFGTPVTTINLTNLQPATSYYARAYSANGTGSASNNSFNYYTYSSVLFSTYNTPPTFASITNQTLCQDAFPTNITLTGISDGSAAETQTVSFSATSSNPSLIPNPTISYSHPNTSGTISFQPISGQSGTAVITVTANDGGPNNFTTIRTFTVTVNPKPAAAGAITTAITTICQQKNGVVFTVPNIANATGYVWSLPSGASIISGTNTRSITVNFNTTASSYNVSVYGTNANGCGNGTPSYLLVNFDKMPTPSNAGPNQVVCNNFVPLTANSPSVGNGAWTYCSTSLGDISSTTLPNANLSITNNQTVTAVWTTTNGVCPASSSTVVVTNINGSPSCTPDADFLASNTTPCVGSPITFTSTSVGATSYTWSFGATATPSVSNSANVNVTYSSVGLKTVTLTINSLSGLNTEIKTGYIDVITVPTAPASIFGNSPICQGTNSESYFVNPINTATNYNWTFPTNVAINTGIGTNGITANFAANAASGNIGVSASNACGTSAVTTKSITVNPLPTQATAITGSNTVCQGVNSVVYTATNLNNGLSYTWSTPNGANIVAGLNTRTITVNYSNSSVSGNVSVFGTNGCGDGATRNRAITVNPLPDAAGSISGSVSNEICPLSTNINYSITPVSGATSYAWVYPSGYNVASGGTSNSIFLDATLGATNGNVKVVGKNACGNGDTSSVLAVNIDGLPTQQICVVTVDSLSTHNEVFWQKNGASNIDSFRVYRKQSLLVDTLIGTVGYNDLSRMVDVTANPNVTSFTYKIAAVDFCGNEGPKSLEHQTIHLQSIFTPAPLKMDLSWNLYDGAPVNNYRVLRDTNNSGNWVVIINNLAPNATSYTDYGIPPAANSVQYRVDVIWLNSCDPTAKVAQSIVNTSKSNTKDFTINIITSVAEQNEFLNAISLYPNPTKDVFEIELKTGIESFDVEVYNQLGSSLKSAHLTYTDKATIDISEFSAGIYFVVVKTKMGSVTKRVTKL